MNPPTNEEARSELTLREVLELVQDCSSQEWQQPDGKRMGATDNQGRRMWFITEDVMQAVRDVLAVSTQEKPAEPAGREVSDEQIEALAHRIATRYTHRSDPKDHSYGFMRHTLLQFARAVLAASLPAKEGEGPPGHVCGMQGYDGMIDPPCPGCEVRRAALSSPKQEGGE